jgi:hypothetical protein
MAAPIRTCRLRGTPVTQPNILVRGAGRFGRNFIADLFDVDRYRITFVDQPNPPMLAPVQSGSPLESDRESRTLPR